MQYEIFAKSQKHFDAIHRCLETYGFKLGNCMSYEKYPYMAIRTEDKTINGNDEHRHPVKTLDEIIDIIEKRQEIKLNDEYTAIIEDGIVKVGCQIFQFEPIIRLAQELQKEIDNET